jgi:Tol biopolymer transport system component
LQPLAIQPGPGDTIYVGDGLADSTGAIFQVNCQTGQQTLIATGGYLNQPVDMALSPEGDLIVVDGAGGGVAGLGNVVSINPRTGGQTLISTGGLLANTNGDSVDAAGDIFVSTFATSRPSTQARILEINPSTGVQSTVAMGGSLDFASGQVIFSRPTL